MQGRENRKLNLRLESKVADFEKGSGFGGRLFLGRKSAACWSRVTQVADVSFSLGAVPQGRLVASSVGLAELLDGGFEQEAAVSGWGNEAFG